MDALRAGTECDCRMDDGHVEHVRIESGWAWGCFGMTQVPAGEANYWVTFLESGGMDMVPVSRLLNFKRSNTAPEH